MAGLKKQPASVQIIPNIAEYPWSYTQPLPVSPKDTFVCLFHLVNCTLVCVSLFLEVLNMCISLMMSKRTCDFGKWFDSFSVSCIRNITSWQNIKCAQIKVKWQNCEHFMGILKSAFIQSNFDEAEHFISHGIIKWFVKCHICNLFKIQYVFADTLFR